ncbi:hypothetical protein HaGV_gp044 [Helicoverpa armigera granulovirus]|uniref:Uncharacterized protein n=1 Tax=Helicoverpa armigera granulovirus TaxID=489830 RepID=A9YMN6_9BBAC|nr:hypothetical protein HaGV_gp044 [Helicoverpa armigera granulovirus]ABY47735.1 unknown [Helicoverpa armigera granulovirus]
MNRSIANWIKERNVCVDKEQRLRNLILVYGNYTNADIQNIDTETLLARVLKKINEQTIEYRSGGDITTTITKDYKNYVISDELGNFTLVNNNPPPTKRPIPESLKLLLNNKPAYSNPESVRNYLNQITRLLAELDSRTAPVQTELTLIATYYGSATSVSVDFDNVTRNRDKLLLQNEKLIKDNDILVQELNEVKLKHGDLQAKCASLQSALDDALSKPGSIVEETVVDTSSINMAPTYADASTNINLSTAANDSANMATQTDNITEDLTRNIAEQQLFEPNDTDLDLRDCLQEAASLREQLMGINQELIALRTEIMSLQQRLVDRNGEIDQLQNTIRQQSTTIKQLQGDNLRLQTDNNELHSNGTNTIDELNKKLTECEQTLADYKNNQDKLIAEIENDAGNFIEEELAKNQSTSNTNEQPYAYIKSLQNTLTEANALNAQLRRQLQECIDSNNSDNLIEQIRLLTENKTTLLQQIAILNNKVLKSEELLENVSQELEYTIVTKNNDIAGLRRQLNECRADLNACNDRHDNPLEFHESLSSQEFSYLFRSHKMFQVVKEFIEHIMRSIDAPQQFIDEWVSQEIITKQMMDNAKEIILDRILKICLPNQNMLQDTIATVLDELNPTEEVIVETSPIQIVDFDQSPVRSLGRRNLSRRKIMDDSPVRERSPIRANSPNENRKRLIGKKSLYENSIPVAGQTQNPDVEEPVAVSIIETPAIVSTVGEASNGKDSSGLVTKDTSPIRDRSPIRNEPTNTRIPKYNINNENEAVPDDTIEIDEPQSLFNKRKLESPEVSPQKRNKTSTDIPVLVDTINTTAASSATTNTSDTKTITTSKQPVGRRVKLQPVIDAVPSTSTTPDKTITTSKQPVGRRVKLQPVIDAVPSTSTAPDNTTNSRLPNYVTTTNVAVIPKLPTSVTISGTADEIGQMTELHNFYRVLYLNYVKLVTNTEIYIQYLENVTRWLNVLKYYCTRVPSFAKPPRLAVHLFEIEVPSGTVTSEQIKLMNDLIYDGLYTLDSLSAKLTETEIYIDKLVAYDKKLREQHCSADLPQLPALPDNLLPVPKVKLAKESDLYRFYSSANIAKGASREDLFSTSKAAISYVDAIQKKYDVGRRKKPTQDKIDWYENDSTDMTILKSKKKPKTKNTTPKPEQLGSFTITGNDKQQLKQIKAILEDSEKVLTDVQIQNLDKMQNEIEIRLQSSKKKSRKKRKPVLLVNDDDDKPNDIITVDLEFDDVKLLQEHDVNTMLQSLEDQEVRDDIDKELNDYYDSDEDSIASFIQK